MSSGDVSRGPKRWKRAADNAVKNPNSSGAKLYETRVRAARYAEAYIVNSDSARFDFMLLKLSTSGEQAVEFRVCSVFCCALQLQLENKDDDHIAVTDKIEGVIAGRSVVEDVYIYSRSAMQSMTRVRLRDAPKQVRDVRCFVCGVTIPVEGKVAATSDDADLVASLRAEIDRLNGLLTTAEWRATVSEKAYAEGMEASKRMVDKETITDYMYLSDDGYFVPVADLPTVVIDIDTQALLNEYGTHETRKYYVINNGHKLEYRL